MTTSSDEASSAVTTSQRNLVDIMYNADKCGQPMKDRSMTVRAVQALQTNTPHRPRVSDVYGNGVPLLLSDIPPSCTSDSSKGITRRNVVLGIDEAGRGSVIGPMIYGMAFWSDDDEESIPKDFNDSKQLTEEKRERLFEKILTTPAMGFGVRVLHASEISRNMLRPAPCNLNVMSHNAAMELIQSLLDCGNVNISTAYVDTVGNPDSYKAKLERRFPSIDFVVESKADDTYAPCSAASIVAKVTRDRMIANWVYSEPALQGRKHNDDDDTTAKGLSIQFGSGYPSDPTCKKWMLENLSDSVFGYCDAVRFSWGPVKKTLKHEQDVGKTSVTPVKITFAADEIHEQGDDATANSHKILLGKRHQQEQMKSFLKPTKSIKRMAYFERRNIHPVTSL